LLPKPILTLIPEKKDSVATETQKTEGPTPLKTKPLLGGPILKKNPKTSFTAKTGQQRRAIPWHWAFEVGGFGLALILSDTRSRALSASRFVASDRRRPVSGLSLAR